MYIYIYIHIYIHIYIYIYIYTYVYNNPVVDSPFLDEAMGKKDQNHLQQIQAKYEDRNVLMAKFGPTMAKSPAVGQFSQMSPMKISVFLEIRGFSLI